MRISSSQKSAVLIGLTLVVFLWLGFFLGSPALPGKKEPIILYSNQTQDDLHLVYNKAIRQAKDSIVLMIYSLKDPSIIRSLNKQSEKGVDVRIICDAKASGRVEKKLSSKIKLTKILSHGIMHIKIFAIDKKLVLIGSANMTTDSLRPHSNLVAGIYSKELAWAVEKKASALSADGFIEPIPFQTFTINNQKLELWFLPDNPQASEKIIELVRSSEKSLRVAMFTFTHQGFANEMTKKPFQAEAVIDKNSGKGVSKKVVNLLKSTNTGIRLADKTPMFHHKFMWIDKKILVLGSANFTNSAFSKNEDCFIVLHDLNQEQKNKLKKLWKIIQLESYPVN